MSLKQQLFKIAAIMLLLVPFSATGQEEKPAWDYPIKPGTEEWKALSTRDEKLKICQIPVDILQTMTTKELVTTCLNYPLRVDFYVYDNLQVGLRNVAADFNGLQELFTRKDNVQCLFDLLKSHYFGGWLDENISTAQRGKLAISQALTETLLSHESVLSNANFEQQKEIASIALKNMSIKVQLPQTYSTYSIEASAYLLGTILKRINNKIVWNPDLELFFKTGTLRNTATIEELKQIYNNLLKQ